MYTSIVEPLITFDMEKLELLKKLSAYVAHSEHIWRNATTKRENHLQFVDECKQLVQRLYRSEKTFLVYQEINSMRHALRQILPNPANASYESSLATYTQIINHCREKLNLQPINMQAYESK
jgi:hypothetical protein